MTYLMSAANKHNHKNVCQWICNDKVSFPSSTLLCQTPKLAATNRLLHPCDRLLWNHNRLLPFVGELHLLSQTRCDTICISIWSHSVPCACHLLIDSTDWWPEHLTIHDERLAPIIAKALDFLKRTFASSV